LARAGGGTTIDGMRIPPVAGRIRAQDLAAAPAQALRAALTQVGRLLLAADELRRPAGRDEAPGAAGVPRAADLPVPRYDELSLPSLRARLRGLDAGQVAMLAGYERAHAGRADVVGMFERRIAKLAAREKLAAQ
jgi:hypothetical protein